MTTEVLRMTPLAALHRELGARLVPFAGYELPLNYAGGIKAEHLTTRTRASLFDVSHMGQVRIDAAAAALEAVFVGDLASLAIGAQRYTLLTNDAGGIVDDVMVLRFAHCWQVVVNGAHKHAVVGMLRERLAGHGTLEFDDTRALLALQGPRAAEILARYCPAAAALVFMRGGEMQVAGIACSVTRSGYTGEDGFELSCAGRDAETLARALLGNPALSPAGLGARDSLRLEAGLCLAGADIDATTTPVAARLAWTIAPKYRDGSVAPRFAGAARVVAELSAPPARMRVGLRALGRVPVRAGAIIHDPHGTAVGRVTSGGYAPSLDAPIAMAYVARAATAPGTRLAADVRGRREEVEVTALPFVPHRYHSTRQEAAS